MTPRRAAATLALLLASIAPAIAQSIPLIETPTPGDCAKYTVESIVTGNLLVTQDGTQQAIKLEARARHLFSEQTLTVADGLPARSARCYDEAASTSLVGGDKSDHSLPPDRRLVVARRGAEGLFCYTPAGPLTSDELDLISEHFTPQCFPGLLPGKAVTVGETWAISNPTAQAASLFDGLIKNTLSGKLIGVQDGVATFTVTGATEGIENGGKVALTVTATGKYDLASKRVVELDWKQTDDREQGPVSPASKVEARVILKRAAVPREPKELAEAATLPVNPPAGQTHLRYVDANGRYQFTYPRDWHITGQTAAHLVLRLLDRGEFIAQVTVTNWAKANPGMHATPEEFKKAVAGSPGWVPGRTLEDGEAPIGGGRWLYRVVAEGRMQETPAVQAFHLLASPQGQQVVVTFTMKPEKVKVVGTRDLHFVNAIEFGEVKK
jgi:hypothetical protein